MKLGTTIIDLFSSVLDSIGGALKMNLADYCDLETIDDNTTLVSRQGHLCTVVEIEGSQRLQSGGEGLQILVNTLKRGLQSEFDKPGRAIQFYFEVDHDRTREQIKESQLGARKTAERLNLDLDDLFEERERFLTKWISFERCYMVIWTNDGVLSKSERKEEAKHRQQILKGKVITRNSQNPLAATAAIRISHHSFVNLVVRELEGVQVMTRVLDSKKALREIRRSIDPGFTSNAWVPAVPGDAVRPSIRSQDVAKEEWEVLWPRLGWQLCPRDANIVGPNEVNIGDRVYVPLYVDQFQKDKSVFAALFGKTLNGSDSAPWRISFLLESSGLSNFAFKGMAASFMGIAGSGNKAIDRSINWLKAQQQIAKEPIVQIRCSLTTWAPLGQNELARKRASNLVSIMGSWGGCEVSEVTGDPVAGVVSSVLGMSANPIGTRSAAPLSEALPMLPLTRPSSPWSTGSVLFRSPDGKVMPFEPYSSLQARWITLIFAAPGSGKSVLMSSLNLALTLAEKNQELPRIAIIDIGPSSGGLISLLQSALPPERRHEVVHKRLRMVDRDAINVFDTLLCCRFPTSTQIQFLRNFMTLLMTDPGQTEAPPGMQDVVTQVLDELYVRFSDQNFPKPYVVGQDTMVDNAIVKLRLSVDKKTTWWEIVDMLFLQKEYYIAKRAQRFAVPLLSDAVTVVQDTKIRENLGDIINTGTDEHLIDTFSRKISTLLKIFPIMAAPTAFDLGEARIAALDLDEVAKQGGNQANWQTGILYMMARQIMAQDFYINDELVPDMPAAPNFELPASVPRKEIQAYHLQKIENLMATPKRLCYDEFHRTSKCGPVQDQVVTDMREGRKFQVDIVLASQSIVDFPEQMREFATSVYILDKSSGEVTDKIINVFDLKSQAERYALENQIQAPGPGGGIFLSQYQTKKHTYTMMLANSLGPIEMWAYSTTAEDVYIRKKCYQRLGPKLARRALAMLFENGGAQRSIERRREEMKEAGVFSDDNLLDVIIEEVVSMGQKIKEDEFFGT